MPREWNGELYDRISNPQSRWGTSVLERLVVAGGETVLDAGCGSGRVTEQLLERLPNGRVIALDGSASMLDAARERLVSAGSRVEFVQADLNMPLPIEAPVDAVVSTATFHWILDHDTLFRNLAAVIRPGGQLVAQCGGEGNIAGVMAAVDHLDPSGYCAWTFASAEKTRERLTAAGFTEIDTWLHDEPTPIPAEEFETFLAEVILGANLARLPVEEREGFVHAVAEQLPAPELDYVRLNIVARKA